MNFCESVYLIRGTSYQIFGSKLTANKQVLSVLFYNLGTVKFNLGDNIRLVLDEVLIFWQEYILQQKSLELYFKIKINA